MVRSCCCAIARSADVLDERWKLLIVRELLPGPRRYTESVASGQAGIGGASDLASALDVRSVIRE